MATVRYTWTDVLVEEPMGAVDADHWQARLYESDETILDERSVALGTLTTEFVDVPNRAYIGEVVAQDGDGFDLGMPSRMPFVVDVMVEVHRAGPLTVEVLP